MAPSWAGYRLTVERPRAAAANMARDEELFAAFRRGAAPPTWRLYTWDRPAVSVGHFVAPPAPPPGWPEDVPLVSRITGGGFVPHGADFTYCVARERRSGYDNYEDIVGAVAAALREMGARGAAVWRGEPRGRDGYCFASLAPFDIHVGGRKLAGCAQRRTRDGVLHQGSIAAAAVPPVLIGINLVDERNTVTLEELIGRRVSLAAFGAALSEISPLDY